MEALLKNNQEACMYLLLVGAMLASKDVRESALKKLALEDVPEALRPLWKAIKAGVKADVRSELVAFQVPITEGDAVAELTRQLQQRALAEFCRRTMGRVDHAKGVDPEQLETMLDSMATQIRAKRAALESGK